VLHHPEKDITMKVPSRKRGGFTLVELAVVVVIIGVLAAFGVPRFLQSVERSKASESFAYLSAVRSAQERYHAREGTYASTLTDLDIQSPKPKYFEVPTECTAGSGGLETGWSLTLTRQGPSAGYGSYTVVYTDQGFDTASTIVADISPVAKPAGGGS
jgi:prepilin-type N-terminal cleavage/methylation domain-containing protein